jgi:hypothetical protein
MHHLAESHNSSPPPFSRLPVVVAAADGLGRFLDPSRAGWVRRVLLSGPACQEHMPVYQ